MSKSSEPVDRCPFPHQPAWTDDGREAAESRATANAEASHLEALRAAEMARAVADQRARARGAGTIDQQFIALIGDKLGYGHPLSHRTGTLEFTWTPEAEERLREVPEFCRELTRWRVEWTAHKKGLGSVITPEAMDTKYDMWGQVSHNIEARGAQQLAWTTSALNRLDRVPDFVRGQVIQAVEGHAARVRSDVVDDGILDDTIARWSSTGDFHEGRFGFK